MVSGGNSTSDAVDLLAGGLQAEREYRNAAVNQVELTAPSDRTTGLTAAADFQGSDADAED